MKNFYKFAFLAFATTIVSGQDIVWQKDVKSSTQDFLSQVITTIDKQYLIIGSSIQVPSIGKEEQSQYDNNGFDFHIIKLNQKGEEAWEKYFSGNQHDYLSAAVTTQEGGFLLAGTSYSGKGLDKKEDSKGGSDMWLIRINEFGEELWQKTIGGIAHEEAVSVVQSRDLGFYVAGNVQNSSKGYGSKDVLIVHLDKNGKELSQLILGGKGTDHIEKMIPTKDGGVLLGIYSRSGALSNDELLHMNDKLSKINSASVPLNMIVSNSNTSSSTLKSPSPEIPINLHLKTSKNFGEGDFWIVKLNKNGGIEWEKNFGGKGDDHLNVLSNSSTGYLIGGQSRSGNSGNKTLELKEGTDIWLISLDEKGEEQWQRSFDFSNRDIVTGINITTTVDENKVKRIFLGGYSQSEGIVEKIDDTFWILCLDENGNEQWRKYIEGESKKKKEKLFDLTLDNDGSIILAGTSGEKSGKENWKVIKLRDKNIDEIIEKHDIKIYPNPVNDYTYVEIGLHFKEAEITLYDTAGRQIQNIKTSNKITKINTEQLIQGVYLIVIKTDKNNTVNAKMIKQ